MDDFEFSYICESADQDDLTEDFEHETNKVHKYVMSFFSVTKVSTLQKTSDSKVVFHEHLENPDFVETSHIVILS